MDRAHALVVRTGPSTTDGCTRVGLSFLPLPAAVLQRLSGLVAAHVADEDASNEAPSTPATAAQAADPRAKSSAVRANQPGAKMGQRATQRDAPKPSPSGAPHPAPSPAANEPTKTPRFAQTLARFVWPPEQDDLRAGEAVRLLHLAGGSALARGAPRPVPIRGRIGEQRGRQATQTLRAMHPSGPSRRSSAAGQSPEKTVLVAAC